MRMTLNYKYKAPKNSHRLSWVSSITLMLMLFGTFQTKAQFSVATTGSFLNNNGSGGVTFNLRNNNSFPIIITGIEDFPYNGLGVYN